MLYHGTIREHALNILSNGNKNGYTWSVSCDDYLYLHYPPAFIEVGESDDLESAEARAIQFAFESAQITAAIAEKPQDELIVLCFDIPESELELDDSCFNLVVARRTLLPDYAKYHVKTLSAKHNSRLDAFIISSFSGNRFLCWDSVDPQLLNAVEQIQNVYVDDLQEFDYSEIPL